MMILHGLLKNEMHGKCFKRKYESQLHFRKEQIATKNLDFKEKRNEPSMIIQVYLFWVK